ncbi:MAG: protein kinase domain-containing protein [Acidimicrobiales bacterium]
MTRQFRRLVVPLLLGGALASAFARAFAPSEVLRAGAAAASCGWVVGIATDAVGRRGLGTARTIAISAAVALVGVVVAVSAAATAWLGPAAVAEAISTFLVVGLPAGGLPELVAVVAVVITPAVSVSTWASLRHRTLLTVAPAILALGLTGLLVAPVGVPWYSALLVSVVAGTTLVLDARSEAASLPPLIGSNTELRRQVHIWRSGIQVVPAIAALVAVALLAPVPGTVDVRRWIEPRSVRVEDPNPLAVAARWRLLDDPSPAATVIVDGDVPGRLRLAVLDEYAETGWTQSADFSVTGETLTDDPVFVGPRDDGPTGFATVTVIPDVGLGTFRALPTAGVPRSLTDPSGMRFAARAGVLLAADRSDAVTYSTGAAPLVAPEIVAPPVGDVPANLVSCPESEVIREVASTLTADTTSARERLSRIESWLLTRRVYDPDAPGGQTVAAVERFVEQPFARGNLEVFVTTYALLARCADVPLRVVVGFPAPQPGENTYDQADITVWVEAPIVDTGWVPLDPVPTPEEQALLAQLAGQDQPDPPPPPTSDGPPPVTVAPQSAGDDAGPWTALAVIAFAATLAVLVLALAFAFGAPRLVLSRRRRVADPTAAVHAAWATVSEMLVDRSLGIDVSHTPSEVVRVGAAGLPFGVPWLIAGLGPLVDRARYGGGATAEDAGRAWAYADAIIARLPPTREVRTVPMRTPGRTLRRLASTRGVERRSERWTGQLPDTALLSSSEAPADLPDLDVDARIGDGSTGTVYRGTHRPTGEPVAVKVFRFGTGDPGFDRQRFEWEVRVAQGVSGLPHLPELIDAGISPVGGLPYLASTLYEEGTLLDRVRRGGPMTSAEAISIGADLSAALDALHQLGVIHADVKPENVFASADGWVLGDLGSAWLRASRGPAATLTPPYAAPEVWRGATPTPAADLYSLALTMLFACTGHVPVAGNPPSLEEISVAFPDHPVVARALDPDARRRPRGVADFARSLRPDTASSTAFRTRTLNLPTPTVTHSQR